MFEGALKTEQIQKLGNCICYNNVAALVENFLCVLFKGKDKTEKSNFGGGNTAWEERALGSWAQR